MEIDGQTRIGSWLISMYYIYFYYIDRRQTKYICGEKRDVHYQAIFSCPLIFFSSWYFSFFFLSLVNQLTLNANPYPQMSDLTRPITFKHVTVKTLNLMTELYRVASNHITSYIPQHRSLFWQDSIASLIESRPSDQSFSSPAKRYQFGLETLIVLTLRFAFQP